MFSSIVDNFFSRWFSTCCTSAVVVLHAREAKISQKIAFFSAKPIVVRQGVHAPDYPEVTAEAILRVATHGMDAKDGRASTSRAEIPFRILTIER